MTEIDICVCTFRRPQLAATLASLRALQLNPDWHLRIIVADNDNAPSAQKLVADFADRAAPLAVQYIHAPARNISIARNACLDAATAPLIAFIDDDETASPRWLQNLMAAMTASNAAVVLGPVQAIYGDDCAAWLRQGDFHATKPVWVKGEIITGYTCNVLMRRDVIERQKLRFREELGRSGGEDTAFFAALYRASARFAYAADAIVTEIVAPQRQSLTWLAKRAYRSGQTHGMMLLEASASPGNRLRQLSIAAAKAGFCFAMAALHLFGGGGKRWLLRGVLHTGVTAKLLGQRELTQYG